MNKKLNLTIGWLYPDLMSTYGDRGNITCLSKRCVWRGIDIEVNKIGLDQKANELVGCDLLFMGGAQDRQQKIAANDLREKKGPILKKMIENGVPGLFVCGAYQFLGRYYRPAEGENIEGLSVFDLYTRHFGKDKDRCIGNVIVKLTGLNVKTGVKGRVDTLVGFENHGGRTYLGKGVVPLGEVVYGFGNNGEDKTEGCIYKNAVGTYLHGPLLPKNPHLADYLVKKALEVKYKSKQILKQIDNSFEWQAHDFVIDR